LRWNQVEVTIRRILVVDDDLALLRALDRQLTRAGFEVRTVTSGPEALEAAESETFDCAVLDIEMPGMDGFELAALLRERHPALAIGLWSASTRVAEVPEDLRPELVFVEDKARPRRPLTVLIRQVTCRLGRSGKYPRPGTGELPEADVNPESSTR
jgi:two-component system response regulator FlrC